MTREQALEKAMSTVDRIISDARRKYATDLTLAIDRGEIEFDDFYDAMEFCDRQNALARREGMKALVASIDHFLSSECEPQ